MLRTPRNPPGLKWGPRGPRGNLKKDWGAKFFENSILKNWGAVFFENSILHEFSIQGAPPGKVWGPMGAQARQNNKQNKAFLIYLIPCWGVLHTPQTPWIKIHAKLNFQKIPRPNFEKLNFQKISRPIFFLSPGPPGIIN